MSETPTSRLETKHTPTPWLRDGSTVYALDDTGRSNRFSATVQGGFTHWVGPHSSGAERTSEAELEANARFIVAACNAHSSMLEALKAAEEALEDLGACDDPECHEPRCTHARVKIRAAILKATEGGR